MKAVFCALVLGACQGASPDLPTTEVVRGDFAVTHFEAGEVAAASGEVVMSPRIGGRLKIIHLWPEGEQVDVGDLILQFDPADFEREMLDREGRLEQAHSDFAKAKAWHGQRLADIKRTVQQRRADLQLAEINQERQQFASIIDQEQGRINLAKARRAMAEAHQESVAQEVVNRVDFRKHELSISRRQERYEKARRDYERTSVYAAKPGIVVYRKIWKPGTDEEGKVAIGDQVWGGRALLEIPDMSKMQVLCLIGEMDIERMRVGQRAFIRLEAFPGPVFNGTVADIAPMASPQPGAPDIHVFELVIAIDEQDARLKPGMSAEVEIVLQSLPDVLSVPLNAVFARADRWVAYRLQGDEFAEVAVELAAQNATAAAVAAGLAEGDIVALKDPAAPR